MRYTNNFNFPPEIVKAILADDYDPPNREKEIPCSVLICPTRQALLIQRHEEEISQDVSDNIWKMFGSSIHYILDKQKSPTTMIQERIYVSFDGYTITGKPDLYDHASHTLRDYKVTSVITYLNSLRSGKKEWEEQLNIYCWLHRMIGNFPQRAVITAILRDWNKKDFNTRLEYPEIAIQEIDIPIWSQSQQEDYIHYKLNALKEFFEAADNSLPLCTPEERWATPEKWAVVKEGNTRATRVFDNKDEANSFRTEGYSIEFRRGKDRRCLHYCPVRYFCDYGKEQCNAKS